VVLAKGRFTYNGRVANPAQRSSYGIANVVAGFAHRLARSWLEFLFFDAPFFWFGHSTDLLE
jgi:hypothetical protein